MATLKNTDILRGYTKEGVAQKYFIYERDKTHEPIEVALNNDIEKQIAYLKENFPCMEDYLLPIVTTNENGKALTLFRQVYTMQVPKLPRFTLRALVRMK